MLYRNIRNTNLVCVTEERRELEIKISKLVKVKVKESRNRVGVALRVPGGLGSQIYMTFGT